MFLIKTNSEGLEEWSKFYTEGDNELGYSNLDYSIKQTFDSGYIILEINGQRVSKLSDVKGYKMGDIESILFLNPAGEKEKIILKY